MASGGTLTLEFIYNQLLCVTLIMQALKLSHDIPLIVSKSYVLPLISLFSVNINTLKLVNYNIFEVQKSESRPLIRVVLISINGNKLIVTNIYKRKLL